MHIILEPDFFNSSTVSVAKKLLGKYLVRKIDGIEIALQINEVETYDGPKDLACHGRFGKTKRNEPMFGPPGCFYVYFVYGVHWMLNIVTGPQNYPAAILIRGAGEIIGPARLTKFMRIDKALNSKKCTPKSNLWVEDRGDIILQNKIIATSRIGVGYAGPIWAKKPYRFVISKI